MDPYSNQKCGFWKLAWKDLKFKRRSFCRSWVQQFYQKLFYLYFTTTWWKINVSRNINLLSQYTTKFNNWSLLYLQEGKWFIVTILWMNLVQDQVQQVGGSKSEGGRMGPPPAVSKPQTPTRGSNWQPWKKNVSNLILFSVAFYMLQLTKKLNY